jgi:hypothetical protein
VRGLVAGDSLVPVLLARVMKLALVEQVLDLVWQERQAASGDLAERMALERAVAPGGQQVVKWELVVGQARAAERPAASVPLGQWVPVVAQAGGRALRQLARAPELAVVDRLVEPDHLRDDPAGGRQAARVGERPAALVVDTPVALG